MTLRARLLDADEREARAFRPLLVEAMAELGITAEALAARFCLYNTADELDVARVQRWMSGKARPLESRRRTIFDWLAEADRKTR